MYITMYCEGIPAKMVIKTGSPMDEVISFYNDGIQSSKILQDLKLISQEYFVVSSHREENIDPDSNFKKLIYILNGLASEYKIPIIVSTHPRTKKRINARYKYF